MAPKKRARGSAHRMVGAALAALRKKSGRTQREFAREFKMSEGLLSSIEQGRRALHPDMAVQMDKFLDSGGVLTVLVANLPEADLIEQWYEEFLEEERRAHYIQCYEIWLIPGLLQTAAYAESLFLNRVPAYGAEEIADRLEDRLRRKEIFLREEPPNMCFVICELALRSPVGGKKVWLEQLRHVRECCDMRNVTVQILPVGGAEHCGSLGPFRIMETSEADRLVYAEGAMGTVLITDPKNIRDRYQLMGTLRSRAFSPQDSKTLLDKLILEAQ
ncbi:helix-turn-helix domain-containing protein [Streptomyces acidiscabies]|uniref:helix-turn-helix domain-containing protein n=1 Tax=Streptomyces acidiscabies TaxID=42234 RepID=UPI0038F799D5